ncbi:hypothetical protein [Candidatus Parabeggiatoa sp. HSG14]|uniref:hypothetical protein n=1 Tax=Candidatus Parabeggiatoa sp. HSG14 TaxID=3055593 RepID=UPI0025A7382E|nr:hypothetical protein [Thiotrichales bacterium HSG14]
MKKIYQSIEYIVAKTMFVLTIIFLLLAAVIIQYLQVDSGMEQLPFSHQMVNILLMIWPFFFLERMIHLIFCDKKRTWKSYLALFFISLLPPLRLATQRCDVQKYIWFFGWQLVTPALYERFEKQFLYPIFIISLLMIPFWVTEIIFPAKMTQYPWLYHLLNFSNAFIWGLFVAEFIIMFSLTEKRFAYLKKHWLELFIIILPMFALARVILIARYAHILNQLRLLQPARLIKIAKLQRLLNIYRAKSLLNRIIRILTIIEIFRRFYQHRNPEKYMNILQDKLAQKEQEIIKLKEQLEETQFLIDKDREKENHQ